MLNRFNNFSKAELSVPEGELSSLEVNLVDELPGWGNDDGFRFLQLTEGASWDAVHHQLLQNREQERSLGRETTHLNSVHVRTCRPVVSPPLTVLPDPVWAQAMRSLPAEMIGMPCFCTGVGFT